MYLMIVYIQAIFAGKLFLSSSSFVSHGIMEIYMASQGVFTFEFQFALISGIFSTQYLMLNLFMFPASTVRLKNQLTFLSFYSS